MGNRLYVGNLSFSTSSETLEAMFAAVGEVREVALPTDRETGAPRGFAFVTMSDAKAANAAIAQLNGAMLDGRALKVNEAVERQAAGRERSSEKDAWVSNVLGIATPGRGAGGRDRY